MLNLVPILKRSLVVTGNRLCARNSWLKPTFIAALRWQWTTTSCDEHNERMIEQLDRFNRDIHYDLSSLASMLKKHTGLRGGDFFPRVVFTDVAHDNRYSHWNEVGRSWSAEGVKLLSFRLYESPINQNKMAIVFETASGVFGKAYWDFEQLELISEEQFSERFELIEIPQA